MKKEIPALFQTLMVQAITEGRKTKTRRTKGLEFINNSLENDFSWSYLGINEDGLHLMKNNYGATNAIKCPYGNSGDILWVRERWRLKAWSFEDGDANIEFADGTRFDIQSDDTSLAGEDWFNDWMVRESERLVDAGIMEVINEDDEDEDYILKFTDKPQPWRPSIFLPKCACRIWLEVINVKCERLQDITESDAKAEGVTALKMGDGGFVKSNGSDYQGAFRRLWKNINGEESWNANPWVWVVSFKVLSITGKANIINPKNYDFNSRNNLETSYY